MYFSPKPMGGRQSLLKPCFMKKVIENQFRHEKQFCIIFSKRMDEQEVRLTQELGFPNILAMPFEKEKAIKREVHYFEGKYIRHC